MIKGIIFDMDGVIANTTIENPQISSFKDTIEFIEFVSSLNYSIALISSSKNCLTVLKSVQIDTLFPIIVEGLFSEQIGLADKPNPDLLIEATRRLNLTPQECLVIADTIGGVQAAQAGNFEAIIALDRKNESYSVYEGLGADYILSDLSNKQMMLYQKLEQISQKNHPYALDVVPMLLELVKNNYEFVVFLDYEGTLTPVVEHPENAHLSSSMHECLSTLCQNYLTVIISSRELSNLKSMVNIPQIYYSGNHGLEFEGAEHTNLFYQIGHEYKNDLNTLFESFNDAFKNIKGCLIENKTFSLSVHYRLVDENLHEFISQKIKDLLSTYPQLTLHARKKVFEIRPNINWNKGEASVTILSQLKAKNPKLVPIYIGDDITDEDAFIKFSFTGFTIKVSSELQKSHANYFLKSPQEVHKLLGYLNSFKEGSYEVENCQLLTEQ